MSDLILRSIKINAYRRFSAPQLLRINGPVTALIGPSQSGKSSVIAALDELTSHRPLPARDRASAAEQSDENRLIVSAQFDFPSDLIEGMAGGSMVPVRHLKHEDGTELTMHQNSRGKWVLLRDSAFYWELPRFEKLELYEPRESFIPVREMYGELDVSVAGTLLAGLGKLDLDDLPDLIDRDLDAARVTIKTAEQRINEHLDRPLVGFDGLAVSFVVSEHGLELRAATNDSRMRPIADQSAGLVRFLSMVGAIQWNEMREPTDEAPPIVLIDELENHLHVDAQTDFVRYLEDQEAVLQVLYTTHSMTALPRDLGTGLRAIVPTGPDQSEIVNSPWSWRNEAGPSPVFIAAGASSSAFVAVRKAVFTEGPSDPILLPTLLDEIAEEGQLDFQCLPGLAWISRNRPEPLRAAAARTVHVVDGDQGGEEIRELLLELDIPPEDIIRLGGDADHDVVLEDLVDPERYRRAVLSVLRQMTEDELPDLPIQELRDAWNRPGVVKQWACQHSLPIPGKVEVAERIVGDRSPLDTVSDPGRKSIGEALLASIQERLPD